MITYISCWATRPINIVGENDRWGNTKPHHRWLPVHNLLLLLRSFPFPSDLSVASSAANFYFLSFGIHVMDLLRSVSYFSSVRFFSRHSSPAPLRRRCFAVRSLQLQSIRFFFYSQSSWFLCLCLDFYFLFSGGWIFRSSLPFQKHEAKYYKELGAAIDAVQKACRLCVDVIYLFFFSVRVFMHMYIYDKLVILLSRNWYLFVFFLFLMFQVKRSLVSSEGRIIEKNDQTPVTVADFGVQALVSLGDLIKSYHVYFLFLFFLIIAYVKFVSFYKSF